MAAGGVGEMEEEESVEDLTPVVKDWMRSNYIKGEVAEEEAEHVDNFENAIANPETDEEQMEEEEGGGAPKSKCPKKEDAGTAQGGGQPCYCQGRGWRRG